MLCCQRSMEKNESIITELAEPVVILSDVHLYSRSTWGREVEQLRGLWAQAKTVIFNGDTINWRLDREDDLREEATQHLTEICKQDGTEPIFLAGNSDVRISQQDVVSLNEGKIFISHGHLFFPGISPWAKHSSLMLQERNRALQNLDDDKDTLAGQCLAIREAVMIMQQHCLEKLRNKPFRRKLFNCIYLLRRIILAATILRAWREMIPFAMQFADSYAPEAKFLIMGHTHKPGIWQSDGRIIINTGSVGGVFGARVVRLENDTLKIHAVKKRNGRYVAGKTIAQFQV